MISYAQNKEDLIVAEYFGDYKGALLDLGANDGVTLSNSCLLLSMGWKGVLVEPSPIAYDKLYNNYWHEVEDVHTINVAVSDSCRESLFYDSGTHLKNGDTSLLSTLNVKETEKWASSTDFYKKKVNVVDFKTLLGHFDFNKFQFISIDCEGEDLNILRQIDLTDLDCRCICIEWNSNHDVLVEIKKHCFKHGLTKQLAINAENIIMAKP